MSDRSESDAVSEQEIKKARLTVIVSLTALVVITAVVFQYSPSFGISELTGLALVWVVLGYAAFFAGSQAYAGRGGQGPTSRSGAAYPRGRSFL